MLHVLFGDYASDLDPRVRRMADRLRYRYSHCSLVVTTGGQVVEYAQLLQGTVAMPAEGWARTVLPLNPDLFPHKEVLGRIQELDHPYPLPLRVCVNAAKGGPAPCATWVSDVLGLSGAGVTPDILHYTLSRLGRTKITVEDRHLRGTAQVDGVLSAPTCGLKTTARLVGRWGTEGLVLNVGGLVAYTHMARLDSVTWNAPVVRSPQMNDPTLVVVYITHERYANV